MRNKISTLVMAAMLGGAGVANAIPLSTLIAGGTLTIDDKVFSGFNAQSANSSLLAQAGQLDVTTSIASGGIDILSFTGPLALDNSAGSSSALGDVTLTYHVHSTGATIDYIDQMYTPNGLPGSGQIIIGETVANGVTIYANSTLTLVPTDLSDPAPEPGDNLYVVPGQTDLNVTKDILITANAGMVVGLSQVDQSFHQTGVPDGGLTLALLGFAMVGVEGLRRRLAK